MWGDPKALEKLRLTDEDKKKIAENWNYPKLTWKEIEELAKKKGIKLTEDDI